MNEPFEYFILEMAIIFGGASILGTLFVWLKQPIVLAYICLGMLVGPYGFGFMANSSHIDAVSRIGIILLMFLLGLHLHPRNLLKQLKQTALVTFICLSLTGVVIWLVLLYGLGTNPVEAAIAGLALAFSSTVLSLKLIPATTLHHQRTGEVMISILLFEDILAILTILVLYSAEGSSMSWNAMLLPLKMALFSFAAWACVRYVLLSLFLRFDIISEYIFLVSLGWCMTAAELAHTVGLSHEIGAFIAGVSIATSPIAEVIAEGLKPVREFFLILFFFSIGAQFDPFLSYRMLIAIAVVSLVVLLMKPLLFSFLLQTLKGENRNNAWEMGLRLGQSSEFSLLLAFGAVSAGRISQETALLIEGAAVVTFIISTYLVVFRLPTPISPNQALRRD